VAEALPVQEYLQVLTQGGQWLHRYFHNSSLATCFVSVCLQNDGQNRVSCYHTMKCCLQFFRIKPVIWSLTVNHQSVCLHQRSALGLSVSSTSRPFDLKI